MSTPEANPTVRWSLTTGVLSLVCFGIGLALTPPGREDFLLSDVLLLACVPLCIAAGFLGSKHWWWLFLLYAIILFLYTVSHLMF
jgi:hypothetical protein